jgi:hypothetical protein
MEWRINKLRFFGEVFFVFGKAKNVGDAGHRRGFLTQPKGKKDKSRILIYLFNIPMFLNSINFSAKLKSTITSNSSSQCDFMQ